MTKIVKFSFMLFVVAIAFVSCQKKEEVFETQTKDPVMERILDFKEDVENPNLKSGGEYIAIEDAVWLIEATLNYTYCLFDKETILENNQKDSISFDINLNNNLLLFNDVRNIYLQLNQHAEQLNVDNKTYLIDIFFEDNKIEVRILFGEENMQKSVPRPWNGFTQEYNYTLADEEIEKAVNRTIRINTPYGYITDIETHFNMGGNYFNPNSNDPNFCQYFMLKEGSGNIDQYGTWSQILTITEMNFYYSGIFVVAGLLKTDNDVPEEKRFISCELEDWLMPNGDAYYPFGHMGDFSYCLFHPMSVPPADF